MSGCISEFHDQDPLMLSLSKHMRWAIPTSIILILIPHQRQRAGLALVEYEDEDD